MRSVPESRLFEHELFIFAGGLLYYLFWSHSWTGMISVSRFTDAQLETNPRRSLHHAPCADRDALASWLVFLGIRKSCGRRTCTKAPVSSEQLPGTATGRKEAFRNQLAQSHCTRLVGRTEKQPPLVPTGRKDRKVTPSGPAAERWARWERQADRRFTRTHAVELAEAHALSSPATAKTPLVLSQTSARSGTAAPGTTNAVSSAPGSGIRDETEEPQGWWEKGVTCKCVLSTCEHGWSHL